MIHRLCRKPIAAPPVGIDAATLIQALRRISVAAPSVGIDASTLIPGVHHPREPRLQPGPDAAQAGPCSFCRICRRHGTGERNQQDEAPQPPSPGVIFAAKVELRVAHVYGILKVIGVEPWRFFAELIATEDHGAGEHHAA